MTHTPTPEDIEEMERIAEENGSAGAGEPVEVRVVTVEEFAAVEEAGAGALVGTKDAVLIPEGGDVMLYGDGGAGKTTLALDLGVHLAAGEGWLDIPIARPVDVLVVENEGPRPLFRTKVKRKLAGWKGSALGGRMSILERPWAEITFADPWWRSTIAEEVRNSEIDVLIAGPVTRLGMDEAGTLQEVRDFMGLVKRLRTESERRLTVILVHHESKGGKVSGAWEGAGDTLLHVEGRGPGRTHLHVQKARWSSEHHGANLELAWTDGEGFTVEDERDYLAEVVVLLADGDYRTAKEIATPRDKPKPGIGAGVDTVKEVLKGNPDIVEERTGEAAKDVGRSSNATVYGLTSGQKSDESDRGSHRTAGTSDSTTHHPVGVGSEVRPVPSPHPGVTSGPKSDLEDESRGRLTGEAVEMFGGEE